MKIKKWLADIPNIRYENFKQLPMHIQNELRREHQNFCQIENRKRRQNWIPVPEEELKILINKSQKERKRYAENLLIGGIDEKGNYTALHHRWDS